MRANQVLWSSLYWRTRGLQEGSDVEKLHHQNQQQKERKKWPEGRMERSVSASLEAEKYVCVVTF